MLGVGLCLCCFPNFCASLLDTVAGTYPFPFCQPFGPPMISVSPGCACYLLLVGAVVLISRYAPYWYVLHLALLLNALRPPCSSSAPSCMRRYFTLIRRLSPVCALRSCYCCPPFSCVCCWCACWCCCAGLYVHGIYSMLYIWLFVVSVCVFMLFQGALFINM